MTWKVAGKEGCVMLTRHRRKEIREFPSTFLICSIGVLMMSWSGGRFHFTMQKRL
jgi:hypothetical protein